jgi:hypothetical protein
VISATISGATVDDRMALAYPKAVIDDRPLLWPIAAFLRSIRDISNVAKSETCNNFNAIDVEDDVP